MSATGLTAQEVEDWRQAAALMYVPRHEGMGIVLQDEHFLERKHWDFARTPPEKHPLLLHYHPLELYRHQVIKQTDVVLATYLAGDQFSVEEKRRTFDYYDPLTTGDSTLSACVQSVIASEVGYADQALEYFMDALVVDLLNTHGNTADGIHVASCGGTWLALVAGFGGLRDSDGEVRFQPRLPDGWDRLRFRVQVRGQVIEVDMTHAATTYRLLEGSVLQVRPATRRSTISRALPRDRRRAGPAAPASGSARPRRERLLDRRRLDVLWFRAEVRLVARGRRVNAPVGQSFGQRAVAQRIPWAGTNRPSGSTAALIDRSRPRLDP